MDYQNTIHCIRNRRYGIAANFLVKGLLGEAVHSIGSKKRNQFTMAVAKKLKLNHSKYLSLHKGVLRPDEIAEEAHDQTLMDLEMYDSKQSSKQGINL